MKKILLIIAISCMPFLSGYAVAAAGDPTGLYNRYNFATGTDFDRMGFGFAQPIITIIPGYTGTGDHAGTFRPVVIIAGGYDPTKDYIGAHNTDAAGDPGMPLDTNPADGRGPASETSTTRYPDKVGNAIYFVDAITGTLVARVLGTTALPSGSETTADNVTDVVDSDLSFKLKHSIAATVTIVDSQGDGVTDRVYFIDVVGNIFRLDLNISTNPKAKITENWKLNKLASLGTEGVASGNYYTEDRRFFNQIDVVRTRRPGTNNNVDALMVGSGNIANPKESLAEGQNKFFVIYDENTQPITNESLTTITLTNLVDASDRDVDTKAYTDADVTGNISGWYWNMLVHEKVVSAVTTIEGVAYFTTIVADPDGVGCQAPEDLPASYLYALDMHTAESRHFHSIVSHEPTYKTDRNQKISGGLAFQQIDPYVSDGGNIEIILPDGTKQPVRDSNGNERKLEGAGSYWRTKDQ